MHRIRRWMLILAMLLCLVWAHAAYAATYYVAKTGNNGNSCSTASAGSGCAGGSCSRLTVQSGVSCLAGGDTLLINNGTYVQDTISSPSAGTSGAHTIIRSMNGRTNVTFQCNNAAMDVILLVTGQQWIEAEGVTFDGNFQCAFPVAANPATNNLTVRNSRITRGRHSGALTEHGSGWLFESNEVDNNGTDPDQDHGLYWTVSSSTVKNNYVHDNICNGIQVQSAENVPPLPSNTKVYGNLFERNRCGNVQNAGTNNEWINNVFNDEATAFSPNSSHFVLGSQNSFVQNNTFYCSTFSEMFTPSGLQVSGNLFYCPGVTLTMQCRDGPCVGSYGSNMLNTNPNFVANGSDFTLQAGSPAINGAPTNTKANPDRGGVVRPQGSGYDYGAHEFVTGGGGGPPAGPNTFYVAQTGGLDSRDCVTAQNIATPRQTMTKGIECLTVGGSTLYLRAGTYNEAFDSGVQFLAGGTDWSSPTTIAAFGTEIVTIAFNAVSQPPFWFRNAANDHYIILDRLILDSQGQSNGLVMYAGAHHIRFQNGEIKNTFYEQVFIQGSDNNEIFNSILHGNQVEPCVNLTSGSDNTVLVGNLIYNCAGAGIQAASPNTGTIMNGNIVTAAGTTQSKHGLLLAGASNPTIVNNLISTSYGGINLQAGTATAKIYNNTVYGNATTGIQVDSGATSALLTNNISAANTGTQILNTGTGTVQTTNLTTAPVFVNAAGGDFHLDATASTAIDVGTSLTADVPKDRDGVTRPQNAGYDLGAYEFVGTPGPTVPPSVGFLLQAPQWRSSGFFRR